MPKSFNVHADPVTGLRVLINEDQFDGEYQSINLCIGNTFDNSGKVVLQQVPIKSAKSPEEFLCNIRDSLANKIEMNPLSPWLTREWIVKTPIAYNSTEVVSAV